MGGPLECIMDKNTFHDHLEDPGLGNIKIKL